MSQLPPDVYNLIDAALSEDETFNDPTTGLLIPPEIVGVGMLRAKSVGVLAGQDVAEAVFHRVDPGLPTNTWPPTAIPSVPATKLPASRVRREAFCGRSASP